MYGRTYVDNSITLDAYRKRYLIIMRINRCMDIHLKKLNEIKKPAVVKKNEETKKVEDSLQRRHQDKVRTFEFLKQGKRCIHSSLFCFQRERLTSTGEIRSSWRNW
jgi:hypothetical protein